MGTLSNLLTIATKQVGIKEDPPNSNNVLYNTWYYKRPVSGKEYPWCMVFCQWCFDQAKIKTPVRTASCSAMLDWSKRTNSYVNRNHLKAGDLVLFNFTDPSSTLSSTHCGIVQSVDGIKMKVIEGNTGVGNDTNGGMVMIRDRTIYQVVGAFRPIFDEEVETMTKKEFLESLSDKEAYDLLMKAQSYAARLPEPAAFTKEGHWKSATEKKLVDGKRPEALVKRDEVVTILGRAGLLK